MVIGDYICVTLRGGAPWGFNLRQEDGDTYRPFVISQVEEESHAFSAGVQEGDEVVSINGEPCADLTLLRAFALIDTSIDSLQLLLKRYCSDPPEDYESGETFCDQRDSSDDALASTTLHILSATHRTQSPRDPSISESQDEAYFEKLDSDADFHRGPHLLCTELQSPLSDDQHCQESEFKHTEVQRCFSAGEMLELQVSLSEQTLDDGGCTSLGSARGIEGEISNSKTVDEVPASSASQSQSQPHSVREPLGQYGVVLSSVPGQVEVILQQPSGSSEGRGTLNVGGPEVSGSIGSQSEGEGGGGHCDGVPRSFTVSFGIPAEEETAEVDQESDSEGDQDKPNRHHARHSRLRRSESLSEKQVKEAKSKCKRIATLLTAAPPNPNNKGVLMFKKHRQRAKKYTLVSYGTGEDESEDSDEEDEDNKDDKQETHTLAFTLVAPKDSEIEKHLLTNSHCTKGLLTINWDKGLLEIERHLNNQTEMECLPESQGKGALMFAQRRQRMEEISAEHDELRRQGIPVEGVKQIEKKIAEHSYMQSGAEGHAYMDVNMHQQSQQQYQQYQEQQYYKQQESYKEQQSYHQQQQSYQQQQQQQQQNYQQQQQYEQQYQQQQHEQQNYQQQMYHQQQGYQEQQQYTANINGNIQHQSSEILSSFTNRTAKPFSVENVVATPYSPVVSGTNQESASQGEQIASRDERIATPAIKTGLLQVAGRRTTGKPMFTFKEAPKVSPSPVLLNLLNRKDRKLGFETGPEEDYLSLGAEACNFLQTPHVKQKIPPPVAPKPMVNPNSLLWSPQIEMNNQDTAQHAQNSVCTPAVAPTIDATPAPEVEPTPAPALEPSPPSAPQEVPASITTEEEQQQTWALSEHESKQQTVPVEAPLENGHLNPTQHPEPATVTTWAPTESQSQQPPTTPWHQSAVQSQEIPSIDSPSQPSWVAQQTSHAHVQSHLATTTWTPQRQPTWSQPEEQAQVQAQAHPSWTSLPQPLVQPPRSQSLDQPQPQPQAQPPWTQSHEQPQLQQMQPTWGQPQEPVQQQAQAPWAQPQRTESPHQPPWVQTPQQKPQVQPPWVREAQPEYQTQPAWVQPPQQQTPQQAWPQVKAPGQPQPPWDLAQSQQPSVNPWNPSPAQSQPPWMHPSQAQPQVQATLNPWTPVPAQAESQLWSQQPPEQGQHTMQSWAEEQNQAPSQPWAQPGPGQPVPQSHWQTPLSRPEPQPPMNTGWPPAPSQPQAPVKVWAPEPKQTPVTVSSLTVNPHPSPKPWQALQNTPESRIPPPPPQRMHSFTIGQRLSSPINPMATTLNPSSAGPAYEMPVVRGKGADMFAKRQSRMEKYVVDSETVQANKESRSASPAASLPNEWKYTPNAPGRSYSLTPPVRIPFKGQKSASTASSSNPLTQSSTTPLPRQTSWLEKGHKPLSPWEAASRHPLGLVDEAFSPRILHQSLASNICLAAQRKMLPEPPAEWKSKVSYQASQKKGSQTWGYGQSHSQRRAFVSLTKTPNVITTSADCGDYNSLPKPWQPRRPATEAFSVSPTEYKRPTGKQTYKSVYTSNTWSCRR
ncbi:synaptopodin-2 isoform X2 [Cynoglossus semilaevis]|uniref:synaptopodin-2 isoform X2 n=1 Tax=Cynoglossus semilaevis TaxID=244447 RepID=UPI0007DCB4F0|nr:synaptopodin-2-like isoform X2 [Cynoglossus semilaevis]